MPRSSAPWLARARSPPARWAATGGSRARRGWTGSAGGGRPGRGTPPPPAARPHLPRPGPRPTGPPPPPARPEPPPPAQPPAPPSPARTLARGARPPQPAALLPRPVLEGRELGRVGGVRRDRQRGGEAAAHQRGVDEQAVADAVDICQQPAVVVPALGVEPQPHDLVLHQPVVLGARRLAEALHGRAGLDGLGRVDADVAHRLVGAVDAHVDGVAVDHAGDRAVRPATARSGGGAAAADEV